MGNALDAGTNLGVPQVVRNQFRLEKKSAWEHSYEGFTDKIFEEGSKRGFGNKDEDGTSWDKNFVKWRFVEDKPLATPVASEISFKFWENKSDYDVVWKYDPKTNSYLRFNGGVKHLDWETKGQISAKNVVIQFVRERGPVDKEGHMFYTTQGKGKALIFQNGDVVEADWSKKSRFDRTRFTKKDGSDVEFVRGEIWIEIVPEKNKIDY